MKLLRSIRLTGLGWLLLVLCPGLLVLSLVGPHSVSGPAFVACVVVAAVARLWSGGGFGRPTDPHAAAHRP